MRAHMRSVRWLGVLLVAVGGMGCAQSPVIRAYKGSLDASEFAIVSNPKSIEIASVDQRRVSKDLRFGKGRSVSRIELLPGTHHIVVTKRIPKNALTGTTYNAVHPFRVQETKLWLTTGAGESYVLEEEIRTTPTYLWIATIVEAGTGRQVSPALEDPSTNAPAVIPAPRF